MLVGADSLSVVTTKNKSLEQLKEYHNEKKDWLFGAFSYDLKNEIEDLASENIDEHHFPNLVFFQPKWIFEIVGNDVLFHFPSYLDRSEMRLVFKEIMTRDLNVSFKNQDVDLKQRISKEQYVQNFDKIIHHIKRGDIYEMNYCFEFYSQNVDLNTHSLFKDLDDISNPPFSAYFKADDHHLICASPERYLKKKGNKIISQPIKGTKERGKNEQEDIALKNELFNCSKERSENVMIVDLVRNDLSKSAKKASVRVEELYGAYSFTQVHHLISTITSEVNCDIHWTDLIRDTFPMGSMTGAPKIMAMKLIEKYEDTKRGLYSGSVGYVTPNGDFDFNVIIRSIIYNERNKFASFMVGGAITSKSNPEQEYAECQLKAKAMLNVLDAK
jgi:para-aminobenzoate synthetase component 1